MMARPKKETMTSKVAYSVKSNGKDTVSLFGGMVLLFLGIIVVIVGIVFLVLYRLPAKIDTDMKVPVMYQIPNDSNEKSFIVSGTAEGVKKVAVYINDNIESESVKVENNEFEYTYDVTKEGIYKVEVAGMRGFPVRYRSQKSAVMSVNIDWSAPSKTVSITTTKVVDTKYTNVSGVAEPNSTVSLIIGEKRYSAIADSNGRFRIRNVKLSEGKNSFKIEITDKAGNSVVADSNLIITYRTGSINGGGATDLPKSAGELEAAMSYILGNKLMILMGMLSLLGLVGSSAVVLSKVRRESY